MNPLDNEEERIDLDDRVWGISGTYVGMEPAPGHDSEQELVYVKYVPAKDSRNSVRAFLGRLFGVSKNVKKTPKPLPKNQVYPDVYTPEVEKRGEDRDGEGQPSRKAVLMADRHGEAPYNDKIEDRESSRINRLESKASQNESEAVRQKAQSLSERSNTEDEDSSSDGRRRPRPDYMRPQHEGGEGY